MTYLLDANAFMEASRLYYGFDITPGFWNWLEDPALSGYVGSVEAVRDEITNGEGELVDWARRLPDEFWLKDSPSSIEHMRDLAEWAVDDDRLYKQAAVDEFLASADLRLIALAMASGGVVTTREMPAPMSQRRIKIPDVCRAFGVQCVDPFAAYRSLGMRLG